MARAGDRVLPVQGLGRRSGAAPAVRKAGRSRDRTSPPSRRTNQECGGRGKMTKRHIPPFSSTMSTRHVATGRLLTLLIAREAPRQIPLFLLLLNANPDF